MKECDGDAEWEGLEEVSDLVRMFRDGTSMGVTFESAPE